MHASMVRRAWLAVVVAGALTFGIAACGDSDEGSESASPRTTPAASEDARHEDSRRNDGDRPSEFQSSPAAAGDPRPARALKASAADTVADMYRALLRGDAKAFCAAQAGAGSDGRCDDDGSLSKIVAASGALDAVRNARIVDVAVDGRRARVKARIGGETRDVWLVRRAGEWRLDEPPAVGMKIRPEDALRGTIAPR